MVKSVNINSVSTCAGVMFAIQVAGSGLGGQGPRHGISHQVPGDAPVVAARHHHLRAAPHRRRVPEHALEAGVVVAQGVVLRLDGLPAVTHQVVEEQGVLVALLVLAVQVVQHHVLE